jgi:precorrin-8X/cobalt-precorrin-8 methylmutase
MHPHEIEAESFRLISQELGSHSFQPPEFAVVLRVIHATADIEYARNLRFHPGAVASGLNALRQGCTVVTDVHMVEAGISKRLLAGMGGKTRCVIDDPAVAQAAAESGETRSVMAMRHCRAEMNGAILAIGNAPTALLEAIRLCQVEGVRPALIVGVPVGYVNAAEAKAALHELDVPHITALGRKGGAAVAVAAVNALLRLAQGTGHVSDR